MKNKKIPKNPLRDCLGILKKDKEWEELEKNLKIDWKNFNEKLKRT